MYPIAPIVAQRGEKGKRKAGKKTGKGWTTGTEDGIILLYVVGIYGLGKARDTMSERNYDVCVCGGGIAGVAAALAAARNGAKTCLLEKEYALGGLATLGLIVIYLPLDDGDGQLMSTGIAEELLKLSFKYAPVKRLPEEWTRPASAEERAGKRYQTEYSPAAMILACEELLLKEGVTLYYDARITGVNAESGKVRSVTVAGKRGAEVFRAKTFIDCTGDADICYFAGEKTLDDPTNVRTGWHFTYDGANLKLRGLTDPLKGEIPEGSRRYCGTTLEDISANVIDGRKFILDNLKKIHETGPEVVIAMRGSNGSVAYNGKSFFTFGIIPCEIVDTLGAGDSYVAGFVTAWLQGQPIPECMRSGARNASRTIGYFGAW